MIVSKLAAKDLAKALKVARAMIYFPGADTTLTLTTVGKDKLTLMAETAGARVRSTVPCSVDKAGTVLIEMTHLSGLHLTGKTIKIEGNKHKIKIRSGRGSYQLDAAEGDAKDVAIPKDDSQFQVEVGILLQAINISWFGHEDAAKDTSDDVRLILGKGKLILENSDRWRGVTYTKPIKPWAAIKPAVRAVMKKGVLEAILKSFDKEATVNIRVSDDTLTLYTSDSLVEHPLVDGSGLADVTGMFKSRTERSKKVASFHVKSKDMDNVATSASCVVEETEKFKSVLTSMTLKDSSLKIQADGDIGSYKTKIPVDNVEGKDITFHVLSKHLSDFITLAARTGEAINLELWGKRVVIVTNVGKDYSCKYMMPLARL